MSLDGLHTSNSPRKTYHPKCTILATDTIFLDEIIQIYFKESLFEDVIGENCSSGSSESIKVSTRQQPSEMTRPDRAQDGSPMIDIGGSGFTCPP